MNCQYAECRRIDRLYDPVSDELDREIKMDIGRANCKELRQFNYAHSEKGRASQSRYAKKKWREYLELCKGTLYGVIGNYYQFFGREPKVDELRDITGHRRKTVIAFVEQLQSEGLIEFNGERIRLVRYWDD